MFQHQGIWLPDGEKHFPEWMTRHGEVIDGKGTYQIKKLREAMTWVKSFRVAVDVGGHVGLWSMHLAKRFMEVHSFEPMAPFRECFARNVAHESVRLYEVALGDAERKIGMHYDPADSGGTHVKGSGDLRMRTLDSYELGDVDFIKLDCEGYEHLVLVGAAETLVRCRPCVIVEQKPHKLGPNFGIKGTPAVDMLTKIGMLVRREMGGDYILSWP